MLGNSADSADAKVDTHDPKPATRPSDDRQNELNATEQALSDLANININSLDDQFTSKTDSVTEFQTEQNNELTGSCKICG